MFTPISKQKYNHRHKGYVVEVIGKIPLCADGKLTTQLLLSNGQRIEEMEFQLSFEQYEEDMALDSLLCFY